MALVRRLAEADRVIVLNPHSGLTKTLKAEELKTIVRAIETSQKVEAEGLCASPGYSLVFFTPGGVHLATVQTSGVVFWIGRTPYHDKSGTITAFPSLGLQ
jgi:hypothetical protein